MKVKLALALAALCCSGIFVARAAQTQSQDAPEKLSQREALGLVRTINTIQAGLKMKGGKYGSLEEVLNFKHFPAGPYKVAVKDSSSGSAKGYSLSVVVSADGQHYQISLRPEAACGYALFSNEAAVIYEGYGLGCAKAGN